MSNKIDIKRLKPVNDLELERVKAGMPEGASNIKVWRYGDEASVISSVDKRNAISELHVSTHGMRLIDTIELVSKMYPNTDIDHWEYSGNINGIAHFWYELPKNQQKTIQILSCQP